MNAALMIERLESDAMRAGCKLPDARAAIARRIGVAPGTLENIRRGRAKRLAHSVFAAITEAFERMLEKQIEAAEHELAKARACRTRFDEHRLVALDAAITTALMVLSEGADAQ